MDGYCSLSVEDIFDYYKTKTTLKTAKDIVSRIVEKSSGLGKNPTLGQREELLASRKNEYRYLAEGNYKIIYWIDSKSITIEAVFDCRQNPLKMKSI